MRGNHFLVCVTTRDLPQFSCIFYLFKYVAMIFVRVRHLTSNFFFLTNSVQPIFCAQVSWMSFSEIMPPPPMTKSRPKVKSATGRPKRFVIRQTQNHCTLRFSSFLTNLVNWLTLRVHNFLWNYRFAHLCCKLLIIWL